MGFEPKNNVKSFSNICHANRTIKNNMLKYSYCNKMVILQYFSLLEKVLKVKM